ncbi:preprotein translocase subunit YajC [bacterium]|nr:preprotein translocase subunit YajC [candidate division CSSED10-310 bacterium]
MFSQAVHAMAQGGQPAAGGSEAGFQFLIPMVLVIFIFYFLIIRPQQKERKRHQQLLSELKAGDSVVTTGGIIGTIHSVSDQVVQLKLNDKTKISVLRSAIRGLHGEVPE